MWLPATAVSMAAVAAVWSRLPARVARLGAGLYRYLG